MQKIPTWYGPDFFPDQRASGTPSQVRGRRGRRPLPFPPIDPAQSNRPRVRLTRSWSSPTGPRCGPSPQFLSTPAGIEGWIEPGSAISANTYRLPPSGTRAYKLEVASEIANVPPAIGFDASDLMPPPSAPGRSGPAVDWINNGGADTDAVLQAIDDSWPAQP